MGYCLPKLYINPWIVPCLTTTVTDILIGTMKNKQKKILLVEDEEAIRTGLIDVFVYHGFEVQACDNGHDGLALATSGRFDLLLLDVMLPGIDGFKICEVVREQDLHQPIIMLTAKSSDEEVIQGLKLGADDYVAKPFSVAQLVLRVEAVLRRSTIQPTGKEIVLDTLTLDTENLCGDGKLGAAQFTRREMDILVHLAANASKPVSREELLNKVWGYDQHVELETRTVDIHIAKIRRKIEINPSAPEQLITVRGAGYRLLLPDST